MKPELESLVSFSAVQSDISIHLISYFRRLSGETSQNLQSALRPGSIFENLFMPGYLRLKSKDK